MKNYITHWLQFILITLLIIPFYSLHAQVSTNTNYRFEGFGSAASGENTPFWIVNHTWGMVPLKANNYYVRGGIFHENKIDNNWNFSLGADVAASTSIHAYEDVWFQQIYGVLNWKFIRLNIGMKEDYTSMLDPYLSTGDFSLSNNARPAPEIKLSFPDFVLVPYTKGKLYIKGDFSIGKFLDGDYLEQTAQPYHFKYMKNTLLHHKSIYFRFGNFEKNDDLRFTFGLDHQAQWGGDIYDRNGTVTHVPHSFKDFIHVFFAQEGGSDDTSANQAYVAGNHAGSQLFKLDYKVSSQDIYSIYWHRIFDDGSGLAFENYPDMMLGFQYKKADPGLLSGFVFEYIYTKQQTGPIHFNLEMDDEHDKVRNKGNGNDDYYNNTDYTQGRSYYGRSLGSPLLLSPEYNNDGRVHFKNNRIMAFHVGMGGYFHPDLEYRLLATYGEGNGRYYIPYSKTTRGIAAGLDLIYTFPHVTGLDIKLSVGFDQGEFYRSDTFGGAITIRKSGIF